MLKIDNFKVQTIGEYQQISADVGGDSIWFQVPQGISCTISASPFIATTLLEAMYEGQDIEVDESVTVSRQLLEYLQDLQFIFVYWNSELKTVDIRGQFKDTIEPPSARVASFYSGGVDGSYTLCRKEQEITHLILMDAFDGQSLEDEWQQLVGRQTTFVEGLGKQLIPIRTNVRQYADKKKISWDFMHGPVLSSIGDFFGFEKVYVPSSFTYKDLFPWGSHPLTDQMWSTESMRVIHHGAGASRWEKVKYLTQHQQMLDNLHVCWRTKIGNCGECPKCVRTMVALHLMNAKSKAIPEYKGLNQLKSLKSMDDHAAAYLMDALVAARNSDKKAIYRRLNWYYKQYQLLRVIENIDESLLGGVMRKLYRAVKKPDWLESRVALGAKERF